MGISNMFKYYHADTPVHRLDPRVKVVWMIVLSLTAVLFGDPRLLLVLWIGTLAVHHLSRIPWEKSRYMFCSFPLLFATIAISQGIFFWGQHERALFTIVYEDGAVLGLHLKGVSPLLARWPGEVRFYQEGFVYGIIQALRTSTLLTAGLTVALTTHPVSILFALRKFHLPYEFCLVLTMSLRFLPMIMDEVMGSYEAQRARGLSFRGLALRDKFRAAVMIFSTVVINTFQGARDTALAIDMRAFRAHKERTYAREMVMRRGDLVAMALLMALAAAAVIASLMGHGAPPAYIYR